MSREQKKQSPRFHEMTCTSCGAVWIGAEGACPRCGAFAKSGGEFTRKTFDAPDLKKGF